MRFRDFLNEKAMNSKTFADTATRLGDKALVGYEFELIVPDHSTLYDNEDSTDRNTQVISYYDDIDEFEEMFEMSSRDVRMITRDYNDWYEEQLKEYIDDNYEKYTDEDVDEDDARARAGEKFPAREHQFSDWLHNQFRDRLEFVDTYSLEPKYGWYEPTGRHAAIFTEPSNPNDLASSNHVKSTLQDALDISNIEIFKDRHEYTKDLKTWYIEPDSSIQGDGPNDHGLEIVSPPEKLSKSLTTLNNVFKWMKKYNLETNSSTGLHIGISIPGVDMEKDLDPVKLVLFMGEKFAAELYGRAHNSTAAPQIQQMIQKIQLDGKLPEDAEDLIKHAYKYLSNDKYRTVNLSKISNGYLEFRIAGGENYHYDYAQARDTVLRFTTALELACDPSAERKEYMKKISKLMDKVKDTSRSISTPMAGFPKELRRIYILDKRIAPFYNRFENSSDKAHVENLVKFAYEAAKIASNFKSPLDLKEVVFIKHLMKKENVSAADVSSALHDTAELKLFKEVYGI